jgi:hypothetical protein
MTSDDRTEGAHPPDAVPGDQPQPSNQPIEEQVRSVPLDHDEGPDRVVPQENAGAGNVEGGGEWPDPDAPAQGPAPGTVEGASDELEASRGGREPSFKGALEDDRVAGGSSSLPEEDPGA